MHERPDIVEGVNVVDPRRVGELGGDGITKYVAVRGKDMIHTTRDCPVIATHTTCVDF